MVAPAGIGVSLKEWVLPQEEDGPLRLPWW